MTPTPSTAAHAPAERVAFLTAELRRHASLYYEGAPEITDDEFDGLMEELQALELEHPELAAPDSPTQTVGAPPTGTLFAKVRHRHPMLSLEKVTTEDGVRKFLQRFEVEAIVVSHKLDGLSLSVRYEGGRLAQAVTRGNGEVGDDVTDNVRAGVRGVPLRLERPLDVEVRGEVVMLHSDFRAYNAAVEAHNASGGRPREVLSNPRSGAAGTLRQKDRAKIAERPVTFFAFDVIGSGSDALSPEELRG